MGECNEPPAQKVVAHHETEPKKTSENVSSKKATFEEAVAASGYGKFHYLLYLAVIPASWASYFDTSTAAMIVPTAECDLNLTLFEKGVLNAAIYAGMVSSALIWGFLADSFGRKPVVFYGYLIDSILNILSGLSQNFYLLAAFKFACGFIVSGPYASVMAYCAEFHCTEDRPRITMIVGCFITVGGVVSSALALLIIPQDWSFTYGSFSIHSWQIYLTCSGIPVLFGTICLSFFPETPKFLMSQGRNEEALKVFRKMYSVNTGDSRKTYPIKELENEIKDQCSLESKKAVVTQKSLKDCVHDGLLQLKPLFMGSNLAKLILVLTIQFCVMLSCNTVRLWQPQLFAMMDESSENKLESEFEFCNTIDESTSSTINQSVTYSMNNATNAVTCIRKKVNNSVYIDTIIMSAMCVVFTLVASVIVSVIKSKHLMLFCYLVAAISVSILSWSRSPLISLILVSLYVGCLSTAINLLIGITVNLFPTTMRTMAVSLAMMFGRIGSLAGNLLFPLFLQLGCTPALFSMTTLLVGAFILALFIPKPKKVIV